MATLIKAAWTATWHTVKAVATTAVKAADAAEAAAKAAVRRITFVGAMLVLHGVRAGTLKVDVVPTTVGPVMRASVNGAKAKERTLETVCGMAKNSGNKTALFRGAAVGYAFHLAKVNGRYADDVDAFMVVCARYGLHTDADFASVNASLKAWMANKDAPRTVTAMKAAMEEGRKANADKDAKAEAKAEADVIKRHALKAEAAKANAEAKAVNRLEEYITNTSIGRITQDVEGVVAAHRPTAVSFMRVLSDRLTATAVAPPALTTPAKVAKVAKAS